MSAGELCEWFAFDARADLRPDGDGAGNFEGPWAEQFACSARVTPKLGGESVLASRLSGTQPVVIRIRYSMAASKIVSGWAAREGRNVGPWAGKTFNIQAVTNVDEKRQYLDILAIEGVAVG